MTYKIKTAQLANMLRGASLLIREQQEKLAAYEQRERVDKVIAKMAEKDIRPELTDDDLRENLTKKAEAGRLDVIEEAVELSADLGSTVIKLAQDDDYSNKASEVSGSELDSFILTGSE